MATFGMLSNLALFSHRAPAPARMFADREVLVQWSNGEHVGPATVCEWTRTGLRLNHQLPLAMDSDVAVITPEGTFQAQVVWLSESSGRKESGLILLPRSYRRPTIH